MTATLDLQTIRRELKREQSRMRKILSQSTGETGQNELVNPDRSDLARDYISQERNSTLSAQARHKLDQIEVALNRLDEGVYGECMRCGKAIEPDRLRARPYALYCTRCQRELESR